MRYIDDDKDAEDPEKYALQYPIIGCGLSGGGIFYSDYAAVNSRKFPPLHKLAYPIKDYLGQHYTHYDL